MALAELLNSYNKNTIYGMSGNERAYYGTMYEYLHLVVLRRYHVTDITITTDPF